jgi:alpha-beta hydrolase superfamily lysophospholipase
MLELQEKVETREALVIENKEQKIFAVLHRPVDVEYAPLVCTFHGFASSKQGSNRSYVYLAEALSKAGVATLRFDFRGSGDSEGNMSELSFSDMLSDTECVFNFMAKLKGIDPARIGLFGASLGGAVAVISQKLFPIAKTMILWAPVASGKLWYQDFLKQNPGLQEADPHKALLNFRGIQLNPVFLEEYGKMNAAADLKSLSFPILHMHGDSDPILSLAHQEAFRSSAPAGSRFITYPDADHRLGFLKNFPEIVQESVQWFTEYL